MTRLWRATVNDSWMGPDGLGWYTQCGQPRTVDGAPMVVLASCIVPAHGWHATELAAVADAADVIEEHGRRLIRQAEAMRAKAGAEVTQ